MKQIINKSKNAYAWIGAIITLGISMLPSLSFATHPSQDPFSSDLGINLQDGGDAGDAFGKFVVNILWWVSLAVVAALIIGAIIMVLHILNMSKDAKEEHGTMGKWATVLIAVVLAIGLAGLLFSGLNVT